MRSSIFIATLPFDQAFVPRYATENILRRTRQNWQWYSTAQKINPGLGTLGYLPLEIRWAILDILLSCRPTLSEYGLWEYDSNSGPPFDLKAYYFGFGRRNIIDSCANNLRLVSIPVKKEYESVFLTQRSFRFNDGADLEAFRERLSDGKSIQKVEIGSIFTPRRLETFWEPVKKLWTDAKDIKILIPLNSIPMSSLVYLSSVLEPLIRAAASRAPKARISVQCDDYLKNQVMTAMEPVWLQGGYDLINNCILQPSAP